METPALRGSDKRQKTNEITPHKVHHKRQDDISPPLKRKIRRGSGNHFTICDIVHNAFEQ